MTRLAGATLLSFTLLSCDPRSGGGPAAPTATPSATPHPVARAGSASLSDPAGWEHVAGGAGTSCSDGSPFQFFVHRGDHRHLLVFFDGGGACWSAATCNAAGSYVRNVAEAWSPWKRSGIFADRPDNPLRSYTIVDVTYCTGDLHLGDRTVDYPASDGAPAITINHVGRRDALAALGWTFRTIPSPEVVVVAGSSAGATPSAYYAGLVGDHYPHARVVQIGDSLGALDGELGPKLRVWGATAALAAIPALRRTTSIDGHTLYADAVRRPNVTVSQFNRTEDAVILGYAHGADPKATSLAPLLARSLAQVRAAARGIRTYTAPGTEHTVLESDELYDLEVSGVGLRQWIADRIAGRDVEDVTCGGCLPFR